MDDAILSLVKKKVHLALPFPMFERYLPKVLAEGLNLEVGLDHEALDLYRARDFRQAACLLKRTGIACTVHAPFCDLSPAAFDGLVSKASLKRLRQALRVARYFEPAVVVFHSGYHPGYHRERAAEWLDRARAAFAVLVEEAEKYSLRLALENVFEREPSLLTGIVEEIDSPVLGYCFDAGHALAFAKSSWEPWLRAFQSRLFELHLHDNHGDWDDHLPPGTGKIPFPAIFEFVKNRGLSPALTFEAHREEDVWPGLAYLAKVLRESGLL